MGAISRGDPHLPIAGTVAGEGNAAVRSIACRLIVTGGGDERLRRGACFYRYAVNVRIPGLVYQAIRFVRRAAVGVMASTPPSLIRCALDPGRTEKAPDPEDSAGSLPRDDK
jgi:hypothetical protein